MFLGSCAQQEARRPVSQKTHSYIKESVKRNQKLVAAEEAEIKKVIARNPTEEFISSDYGFWYAYTTKNETDSIMPLFGDAVTFTYTINSLNDAPILTKQETGIQRYKIDQTNQDLITGIREGLKLMKEGETVDFYFPSYLAYGYYGIPDKLGSNYPIKSTVTLLSINQENN